MIQQLFTLLMSMSVFAPVFTVHLYICIKSKYCMETNIQHNETVIAKDDLSGAVMTVTSCFLKSETKKSHRVPKEHL